MIKIVLFLVLFVRALVGFNYDDIAENFHEWDEKIILKRLDIDPNFIFDLRYNDLKNRLKKRDIIDFQKAIKKNPKIFFTLKELVKNSNMPDEFLYMAMVESKFLISAKSHKNAAGLWQIMPQTAKILNLKVNSLVDERLDPIKSTKAAIKYITYLHNRFKKWYLAALAYNCGETKLSKAIDLANSDDIFELLDEKKNYLPKETKLYIRRVIVAALIANSKPIQESIKQQKPKTTLLKELKNHPTNTISSLSKKFKIDLLKTKKYNAHILTDEIPTYADIYLPSNYIKEEEIRSSSYYKLTKDSTLFDLSRRFNTSIETLKKLNKIDSLFLKAGTILKLPYDKNQTLQKNPPKIKKIEITINEPKVKIKDSDKNESKYIKYKIKKDDTIFTISLKYNNKISTIKKLNPKIGYDLKEGETILLMR